LTILGIMGRPGDPRPSTLDCETGLAACRRHGDTETTPNILSETESLAAAPVQLAEVVEKILATGEIDYTDGEICA
jgi:hypothetical protein